MVEVVEGAREKAKADVFCHSFTHEKVADLGRRSPHVNRNGKSKLEVGNDEQLGITAFGFGFADIAHMRHFMHETENPALYEQLFCYCFGLFFGGAGRGYRKKCQTIFTAA